MAEYESLHQLIVKNPWICRDPLSWTDKHLKLLNIQFQPIAPIAPYPSICRSYCDPSIAYGKQFVAGLTSEAKRAALVKLFRILGCGLVHPTEAMATFMFAGKEVHTTSCWISHFPPPVLYEYPMIGYFHYDDVKIGGNAPVARLCRKRLRAATPAEWSKDPYIVGLILSLAQWSWRQERHPLLLLLPVRLIVTTDHDPKTVHVFKANVSIRLLECIYWPGLSLEGVTWPVIRHLQVASEPVCNFPDRLLFEVLGVRYF
ncbi:uncharacterized protein B0J16DRAFT_386410 [Fusarium flagelliforme]|uniref:uncharacterized protein n=1 Tax=Fusarium flagelliforme TaxID=2675880 RepID=UPI001E8E7422|nr:uncharacterized protein B0J16DRAFT_386410 [Fusarium flagelliforme]KAH7183353.1 hypothetical protein B0J16DRAFT_386410 [Fusarium flagelliforme]